MKQTKSVKLLIRAKKVIPGQTSTISKMYNRFPIMAPAYLDYGEGCFVWDVDGNEYIDWSASLGTVILGYDNDFGKTNRLLPMPSYLEIELAEKLVDIIPCAEMVRFFKTGSDACTAAVKLCQMVRGINEFVTCGYHGWHIPDGCPVEYGDLSMLENLFQTGMSCFILEPMDRSCPDKYHSGYVSKVKDLCNKYGVILIFDEILTGFRYGITGIQGDAEVVPDLACYSKAMSNGKAISALVGKKELMKEMRHMRISGTYYTEPIPMIAALDTIKFIEENKVMEHVWLIGEELRSRIIEAINDYGLNNACYVKGFGPWNSIEWNLYSLPEKQLFLQEIFKRGIFYNRDHFAMFSHSMKEVKKTVEVYREAMEYVSKNRGNTKG